MEVSGKKKDPPVGDSNSASGINTHIYCDPCKKDGLRLCAHGYCQDCTEHLCESCYKTHKKPAPCRNHVLLDKTQMPKFQSSGHFKVPQDLTKYCHHHKDKLIEYICHEHNTLGCSPCITINHRMCKVAYIPDVSTEYKTSDEYGEFLQSLSSIKKQCTKFIEDTNANKMKILRNKSLIKDEIKKFRQEITNMCDNLETSLQKHADDIFAEESARIEDLSSRSVKLQKDIEQLQDEISNLEKANKSNTLYIRSKESKETAQQYASAMKQMHDINYVNNFVFTPNLNLKEILESKTGIGELNESPQKGSLTDPGYFDKLELKYSDEINVKDASDKSDCFNPGAVFVTKDTLAVVDSLNKAVKIIDTKMKKITTKKTLPHRPSSLDLLPNDILAVACKNNMIMFLSIAQGLSEVRRLKVKGGCNDVVYHDRKLIVTLSWPGSVRIMDLDGNVGETIEKDFFGKDLTSPCVTVDIRNNIYISDWDQGTVTSVSLKGEVMNGYKDERLVQPRGMVVLANGSILVCSSGNDSIILISENLGKSRVVIEGKDCLHCPWCLAFDKENNQLYVGSGNISNIMKVYELK